MTGAPAGMLRTILIVVLGAVPAAAQGPAPRSEAAVTAGWVGPTSFGTRNAELTQPSGAPLVIFRTENRLAPGTAFEVHLGRRISPRLMVEASGGWHRADFETRITDDIEDADTLTLTQGSARFTVEGALLWTVVERGAVSVFARGGGGWLRELADAGVVVEDGAVGTVGAGVKYWWRDSPGSRIARVGLRIEGRASLRSTAITLGDRSWRLAPLVAGGIVFGF